jgi:hypothetical protein
MGAVVITRLWLFHYSSTAAVNAICVVFFVLCSQRSSSRVYLHDVSVMQLRYEVLSKVRKQRQTINT